MNYRELDADEPVEAGDWWAFEPQWLDDRMTFSAPNWFDHPTLGKCFRIDHYSARLLNNWSQEIEHESDGAVIFREVFEDF